MDGAGESPQRPEPVRATITLDYEEFLQLRQKHDELRAENDFLQARINALEEEVNDLGNDLQNVRSQL